MLEKFGRGRVKTEQKEELRSSLVRDLESKGLAAGFNQAALQEEVEKFLQNGHISGSNLNRLERRVLRRMRVTGEPPDTPNSAREQRPATSEFSVGSRSAGSRTPRTPRSQQGARTPGSSRGLWTGGLEAVGVAQAQWVNPKWSEVANYAKVLEEKEKVDKRFQEKARKERMRKDLEQQMLEKEQKKLVRVEEEKMIFERQKVELRAWHEAENAVVEEQKRIALEVRKEREIQNAVVRAIKEEERKKRHADDYMREQHTAEQAEQERRAALDKKNSQRDAMQKLMAEWAEDRRNREAEQKRQAADEQVKVNEYQKMLDTQEARNKKSVPPTRMPLGEYSPPNKAERLRKERQKDEELAQAVRAANAKAAEEELQKTEKKNKARTDNQEFLFKQMTERENARKTRDEELKQQKESVLAEEQEFIEWEKQRIEKQRMKNIQHRVELEKQIEMKKPPTRFQKRHNEDLMSAAEVAMNRHLLEEARTMASAASSQVGQTQKSFLSSF